MFNFNIRAGQFRKMKIKKMKLLVLNMRGNEVAIQTRGGVQRI